MNLRSLVVAIMHVFSRPKDGKLTLNGLVNRPVSAAILGQSDPLAIAGKDGAWTIQFAEAPLDPISTVIVLSFQDKPTIQP